MDRENFGNVTFSLNCRLCLSCRLDVKFSPAILFTFCFAMRSKLCAVPGCFQLYTETTKESFFAFPGNVQRLEQWRAACGLEKADKNKVICVLHFSEDSFKADRIPGSKPQLRLTAVPNQSIPLITHDENAGCAPKKRRVLMDIPAPGQIPGPPEPDPVAMEGLE